MSTEEVTLTQHVFDNESWRQFNEHYSKSLYTKNKTGKNYHTGSIVLLQNIESKQIMGIAKLGTFPEGKTIRERNLLEEDQYKGRSSKWNLKYEICIASLKIFSKPITFTDFAFLFGIDNSIKNNISKGTPSNGNRLFYKKSEEDEETVQKKLRIWAESHV